MSIVIDRRVNFKNEKGIGIFVGENIGFNSWGINPMTIIETPVSFGGKNNQFDIGFVGAFTYINGQPHNKYNYKITNIDADRIGRFCMIAQGCTIGMGGHPINSISASPVFKIGNEWCKGYFSQSDEKWLKNMTDQYNYFVKKPLPSIGNDVWIGAGVWVMNGVKIGNGAVVAAGAVVVDDIEPYTVVGGVPAKPIKKRFNDNQIEILERIKWWEYGPDIMVGIDMYNADSAINELEKRIQNSKPPKYCSDCYKFDWDNNIILKKEVHNDQFIFFDKIVS